MDQLPDVTPLPPLPNVAPVDWPKVRDDARDMLPGLAPGWYRSRDLHPRYAVLARSRGHEVATVKTLGEALYWLRLPRRSIHGNVTGFEVSTRILMDLGLMATPTVPAPTDPALDTRTDGQTEMPR